MILKEKNTNLWKLSVFTYKITHLCFFKYILKLNPDIMLPIYVNNTLDVYVRIKAIMHKLKIFLNAVGDNFFAVISLEIFYEVCRK